MGTILDDIGGYSDDDSYEENMISDEIESEQFIRWRFPRRMWNPKVLIGYIHAWFSLNIYIVFPWKSIPHNLDGIYVFKVLVCYYYVVFSLCVQRMIMSRWDFSDWKRGSSCEHNMYYVKVKITKKSFWRAFGDFFTSLLISVSNMTTYYIGNQKIIGNFERILQMNRTHSFSRGRHVNIWESLNVPF